MPLWSFSDAVSGTKPDHGRAGPDTDQAGGGGAATDRVRHLLSYFLRMLQASARAPTGTALTNTTTLNLANLLLPGRVFP